MKYQYYIASRWRNKDTVMELTEKLRTKDKTVFCFMDPDTTDYALYKKEREHSPEEWMQHVEALPDWQNNKDLKEILKIDHDALRESENLILLLPAGKSAHLDAGMAHGLGKKCILIGEQKEAEIAYMIFSEFYDSIDEFVKSL